MTSAVPLFDDRTLRQRIRDVGEQPDPYGVDSCTSQVIRAFPIVFVVLSYPLVWVVRRVIRLRPAGCKSPGPAKGRH